MSQFRHAITIQPPILSLLRDKINKQCLSLSSHLTAKQKGSSGILINTEEKLSEILSDQRLIGILFQLAKKAEQGQFKDINYQFIIAVFREHKQQFLRILANQRKILHVAIFFIVKYFTNKQKLDNSITIAFNSFLFTIIDLFLGLLQSSNAAKSTFSQFHKLPSEERSYCIQALLLLTEGLYVQDININAYLDIFSIAQGLKIVQILIHQVEKEKQFEIVRKMVGVLSNIIVFGEVKIIPLDLKEFCLGSTHQSRQAPISKIDQPTSEAINRYFEGIKFYLKLDPLYHSQLLLNLKKWIILNIESQCSFKHIQVMIDFIEQRLFPLLQNQLFIILIQSQNHQNSSLINKIIIKLLKLNRQQLSKQVQKYLLILAQHGNSETKKQVATYLYCFIFQKDYQLLSDSINFILNIYLSQNLSLLHVQNVLTKYSQYFSSQNVKKLHQQIGKKKDNIHLALLSNFCFKRGEFAAANLSSLSELLVHDEWLQALGDVYEPYIYYFNAVGSLLFGRNFMVSKENIDKNPKTNKNFTEYCCKIYERLIKSASQRLNYQQNVLRHLFFFQSILQEYSKVNNIPHLEKYIIKIFNFSSDFFEFLLSAINFSRNYISIKLLLQILLLYSEHQQTFIDKNNQISKIISFIYQATLSSEYFRLSTYSFQSLALLYQLSLRHTTLIENSSFLGLIEQWSSIMNHQQIKSFCYFFIFREIKLICPYLKQREMQEPLSRLKLLWVLIFHLLDRRRQPCSYLHMSSNKIICEFIDTKKCKKGLKIEGTILKNCNLEMSWHIHIETLKQIYTISIKGCSITIDQKQLLNNSLDKMDKKTIKDYTIREISKLGQSFTFKLQLQSSQKIQMKFQLNDFSIFFDKSPFLMLQGDIRRIKICGKNDFILKQIKFVDKYSPGSLQQIQQHIHILNKWNIKTLSLNFIESMNFIDKFDFQHAFSYFAEMIKSFSHMSLPITYSYFINLALKMFGFNHKQSLQKRPTIMIEIFNKLAERFHEIRGKSKELRPEIQTKYVKEFPRQFYFLSTSALLPKVFWNNFSEKTKDSIKDIILQLIQDNKIRLIQNNSLDFFEKCLQIGKQKSQFLQICSKIITTHCLNNILKYKFKRYIFLAKQQKSIETGFKKFITSLIRYLNVENESYIDLRQLAKYLILNKDYIQIFFSYCQTSDKITIIHYLSENQVKDMKFKKMKIMNTLIDKKMNPEEQSQFLIWLIIQSKQLMMKIGRKMIVFKDALEKVTLVNFYVQLMLKFRNYGLQQEKVNLNQLIFQGLKVMNNEINCDDKLYKIGIGFNIDIYITSFFEIWQEKILLQKNQGQQKRKLILQKIQKEITDLITQKFDKKSFLIFMKKLRILCCSNPRFLLFILTNQKFKKLSIAYLSVFLQFLFQILIKIQNKDTFTTLERDEFTQIIFNLFKELIMVKDKTKMQKFIYYSYPFISCNKNYNGENAVDKLLKMEKIQKKEILQLNGGIYFKSLLILSIMMKIRPFKDYTALIEIFLFGPETVSPPQRPKLLSRTNSDGNQAPLQRTPIQKYLSDTIQNHKYYYFKDDLEIIAETSTISLNPYFCDYLLLFFSEYLCQNASHIDKQRLKKYNELFVKGCLIPSIWQQLIKVQVSDTASTKTNQVSEQNIIFDDRKKQVKFQSPAKMIEPQKDYRQQSSKFQLGSINQAFSFFNPNSPRKTFIKKKPSLDDMPLISSKKLQVFELIKKDYTAWYKFQNCKNIPTYFCQQAKQIRFKQKLHVHYVTKGQKFSSEISVHEKSILLRFEEQYDFILSQQKTNQNDTTAYLDEKSRKVKKIFPYTCKKPPVNRIVQNALPNMTCPAICKMVVQDYEAGCWTSQHSINMNLFGRDDIRESEYYEPGNIHQLRELTEETQTDYQKQKLSEISGEQKMESDQMSLREKKYCELIIKEGAYFCEYSLDSDGLKLQTRSNRPSNEDLWYLKLGTPTQNLLKTQNLQFVIFPMQVSQVFFRRFNQILYNSLEIFLKNGTSRYISFYKKQYLLSFIRKFEKIFSKVKIIKDPVKEFEDAKYTQKWVEGFMTNFDYLMLLNKFSGRNYNDVNQYYVFPWVLKDYTSERIDLTNLQVFRDLSKPIGALNPQKLKKLKEKYKIDTSSQRSLYGSHYSTSLFIFYYLIRLQPFSSLHRNLQKGDWDIADRLFNSISQVWASLMCESTSSDIKQCIPQFYYMPTFLKNTARIEFGQKQCGESVSDVELPKWAKDPQQFIITMRSALESDYVSQHLHQWIDLIFGKHQNSLQKNNSFHPYSYTEPEILSQLHNKENRQMVQGIICQITYFGQCPIQLFKKQHKQKNTISQSKVKKRGSSEMLSTKSGGSALYQQYAITPGRRIIRLDCDLQHFYVEIQSYAKDRKWICLQITATIQQIKEELQKMILVRKQHKPITQMCFYSSKHEIRIHGEIILDLSIKFDYKEVKYNDLWIACYGKKGLKIYNWQLQQRWCWLNEEVNDVYLEATRIIFSTSGGKLCFYSFFDHKLHEYFVFKDACDMKIKVAMLPRLPSQYDRNVTHYKILCAGDLNKLVIVSYAFQEITNYTSMNP